MTKANPSKADVIFYDGDCPMCQRSVVFLARRDQKHRFLFAPLGGETFRAMLTARERGSLPDSMVVHRADGSVLVRSTAVLYLLHRLGGTWDIVARGLMLVPSPLRDIVYRFVAWARPRRRKGRECPLPPPAIRKRLLP